MHMIRCVVERKVDELLRVVRRELGGRRSAVLDIEVDPRDILRSRETEVIRLQNRGAAREDEWLAILRESGEVDQNIEIEARDAVRHRIDLHPFDVQEAERLVLVRPLRFLIENAFPAGIIRWVDDVPRGNTQFLADAGDVGGVLGGGVDEDDLAPLERTRRERRTRR